MRVEICVLRVGKCELILGVASCKLKKCELQVPICELILRVASFKLRVDFASCELRVKTFELKIASCEFFIFTS